ncbi:metal ABC transporter permease [Candidatus Peribacteria bacterium]|nr:metal ABC transporter permease [Candidatus Peribacteria bacterium]
MIPSIFQYEFMILAFIAGIVTAIVAPTMGVFLVIRRYSFMADTLAHVSLAGVTVGFLTGTQPILSAMAVSAITAIWVEELRRKRRVLGDSALSMFLSGGLALAAVLLSASRGLNVNLHSVLFGSIATVNRLDVWIILSLGVAIFLAIVCLYKELSCIAFDEELAETGGVQTRLINHIFVILTAITVSVSMRIVGILLIGALMVIPVTAAMQLSRSFRGTLWIAIALSLLSVIAGLFIAYYVGFSSGGTIVLLSMALFFLANLCKKFVGSP